MDRLLLNGEWVSADDPRATHYVEAEFKRQRKAKEDAKKLGFEVLTPQAATTLFNISASAVRQARLGGHVYTTFTVDLTGRPLHLLHLQSAIEYWEDKKRDDFADALDNMRKNGHVLGVSGIGYNVLHDKPIVRLNDVETVVVPGC
jgi:hypothetical protein